MALWGGGSARRNPRVVRTDWNRASPGRSTSRSMSPSPLIQRLRFQLPFHWRQATRSSRSASPSRSTSERAAPLAGERPGSAAFGPAPAGDAMGEVPQSVARAGPRVTRGLPRDWNELPRVRPVTQRELEDTVHPGDAHLAVGDRRAERVTAGPPSRAHDELPNPVHRVGRTGWGLRGEPLVVVLMPREHDFPTGVVQRLPQRLGTDHAARRW